VLINGEDGTIIGFAIGEGVRNKLDNILNPQRSRIQGYVRADADLHVGNELIVVPDNALIEGEPRAPEADRKSEVKNADETAARGWGDSDPTKSTRPSIWTRRTDAVTRDASKTPAETRIESETARPIESTLADESAEAAPEPLRPDREAESITTTPPDDSRPS
jgi:metal-dependent amidase/aminoacylase/carboxypeptidase family protein